MKYLRSNARSKWKGLKFPSFKKINEEKLVFEKKKTIHNEWTLIFFLSSLAININLRTSSFFEWNFTPPKCVVIRLTPPSLIFHRDLGLIESCLRKEHVLQIYRLDIFCFASPGIASFSSLCITIPVILIVTTFVFIVVVTDNQHRGGLRPHYFS